MGQQILLCSGHSFYLRDQGWSSSRTIYQSEKSLILEVKTNLLSCVQHYLVVQAPQNLPSPGVDWMRNKNITCCVRILSVKYGIDYRHFGSRFGLEGVSALDRGRESQKKRTITTSSYVPSPSGTNSAAQCGFIDTYSQSSPGFSRQRQLSGLFGYGVIIPGNRAP